MLATGTAQRDPLPRLPAALAGACGGENVKGASFYGGQAVIEGVMMRGRTAMAIGLRRPDGGVLVHEEAMWPWTQRFPAFGRPFIRGVVALVEALLIGIRALNFSAEQLAEGEGEKLGAKELAASFAVAVAAAAGLFVVLPAFVIRLVEGWIPSNVLLNMVEGLIKIGLFTAYILAIGRVPDIRRVFQYHGAEHKAINCYEAGMPLTVDNVERQSIVHIRCGTNFILIVLFMSVFVFSFFGRPPFGQRVVLHLVLLPVVAGLSYEIIRLAARENALVPLRWIATPGLWMQRLTTRQPDRSQIEVAIAALERVLVRDGALLPGGRARRRGARASYVR
ncbi:MAG: DUF1385 domain-containing protein [Firmicutes bacterium]|nr:DUF1385 domain-containing protein [Bacillota bacterium]